VETVNHVLDFTKLSGNARSGGVDQVIPPTRSDLMQLIEEAVEGCWIGHRARLFSSASEIGSVYSPPEKIGRPSCGKGSSRGNCGGYWARPARLDVGFREGWHQEGANELVRK
jgi:hypothetical protein